MYAASLHASVLEWWPALDNPSQENPSEITERTAGNGQRVEKSRFYARWRRTPAQPLLLRLSNPAMLVIPAPWFEAVGARCAREPMSSAGRARQTTQKNQDPCRHPTSVANLSREFQASIDNFRVAVQSWQPCQHNASSISRNAVGIQSYQCCPQGLASLSGICGLCHQVA